MIKQVLDARDSVLLIGCWLGGSSALRAQIGLPTVMVAANKIEQMQETVPTSHSVLCGEGLRQVVIDDLQLLAHLTPGFTFQPFG